MTGVPPKLHTVLSLSHAQKEESVLGTKHADTLSPKHILRLTFHENNPKFRDLPKMNGLLNCMLAGSFAFTLKFEPLPTH